LATGSDVPEAVLQMPDAAAQLMVSPLFRRGILCFEGGIGGDVLRHIFGPDDFFGKQIKTGRGQEENMKREIMRKNEEQIKKELTSESYASLMSRSPGVAYLCPWLWGFLF
jgi:hypothetical protein